MRKTLKLISLLLSVLTFIGIFSVSMPVFAAEIAENVSETEESVLIDDSDALEESISSDIDIVGEVDEWRTEDTKYFRLSDGSFVAAKYPNNVHYEENGVWKDIDYNLTLKNDEYTTQNTDNDVSFPDEFSQKNDNQIEISSESYTIKFSPVKENGNGKNKKATIKENDSLVSNQITNKENNKEQTNNKLQLENYQSAITYDEVYDNVSLEYEISSNVVKESIVLNKKQGKNKFDFILDTDGLFPKIEDDGSVILYKNSDFTDPVSVIQKPFMYDSNNEVSYDVTYALKEKKNQYVLTIQPSNKWLNDKSRVYPVVIDPTIIVDAGRAKTYDCYVDASQASTSFPYDYYIYAGNSSYGKTRTFIKFDLPDLPDKCSVIQNASIYFFQNSVDLTSSNNYLNIYEVTENWENDRTVTWNNQPTYNSKVLDYAKFGSNSSIDSTYCFDVTRTVKSWYEGGNNYGLMLKSADESVYTRAQLFSAENTATKSYPVITVKFKNNKGIESYWSYSSYSIGNAGNAYVNDYTGNLVYEMPILSSISEIAPLTLTGYFNNYCAGQMYSAGKSSSYQTSIGRGFRLNIQQTVLPSSKYGLTGTAATNYPYVYADADGTEHYFKKETKDGVTTYKDEDGLGLTLIIKSSGSYKYRISNESGNKLYFNTDGNLYCQKDANDNEIRVYFNDKSINYIKDGAGHTFTFKYYTDTNYVKTITDNAGRVVTFNTSSGRLNSIKYDDGTYNTIVYEGDGSEGLINYVQDYDGYALNFDYTSKATGRKVATVKEYGRNSSGSNVKGQIVTFDRTKYNQTIIRSAGMDGYHVTEDDTKGNDDIINILQFDNFGRTISQISKYGSGSAIGAGNYSYTSGASTLGSANKVSSSASLGKNVVNLATNIGAETSGSWSAGYSGDGGECSISSTEKYVGNKSFKLKNSSLSTTNGGSYYRQTITGLTAGGTYTLSAYVKVTSLSSLNVGSDIAGASLAIVPTNGSAVYSPEKLTKVTDSAINKGWRRISVTATLPDDSTSLKIYLELRGCIGVAYFDNVQLESGSVANDCNLIENGSFEKYSGNTPTSWSAAGDFAVSTNSSGTVTNGSTTVSKINGSRSLRITGKPDESNGMAQTIPVYGNENDTYILSGWSAGYPINHTYHDSGKFEIAARVNYTRTKTSTGETENVSQYKDAAEFNTTITGWQFSSTNLVLKYKNPASGYTYTPKSITVVPRYNKQSNWVYFDHIQLIKDVASSYTYDSEGNVVSVAANAEQKDNMTYEGKDLKTYKDTLGYKTTFDYDDKHNLKSTTSAKGLKTNFTYNANGNVLSTETTNGTSSIKTEQTYYDANEDYGIVAGAYKKYSYNEHGYGTKEECSWKTGIPKKTIDAKGNATNYTYTDDKLTKVTTGNVSVQYNYNDADGNLTNRMNNIILSGTDDKSENYSFVYDNYGNILKTSVGSQALSTNTYSAKNGVLTKTTYGNDDYKSYAYTNAGYTSKIYKNSTSASYAWQYASDGTTKMHRDAENNRRYLYSYDAIGRLIRQEIRTNETPDITHIGSTEFGYDERNNLTKVAFEMGGRTYTEKYLYAKNSGNANAESYAKDNLISRYVTNSGVYHDYFYDSLNRLNKKTISTSTPIYINYEYKVATNRTSTDDLTYRTTQLNREYLGDDVYQYQYDVLGNITAIQKGTRTSAGTNATGSTCSPYLTYTYDSKNQLTSSINSIRDITSSYSYDSIGNILSKTETSSDSTKTITYSYGKDGKSGWNNLLVGVDFNGNGVYTDSGEAITYDNIGNPTSYLGATLTWEGRELESYSTPELNITYTYDADGLRGTKTVNGIKSEYLYVGDQLRYEKRGTTELYYGYDGTGNLASIQVYINGTNKGVFYALTNAQGDVVALCNASGTKVVTYEYDDWGKLLQSTDTSGFSLAEINPIRYRGYYYDSETELYYLQSRYYNPEIGRFLNADTITDGGSGVLGNNLFVYTANNPINNSDPTGHWIIKDALQKFANKVRSAVSYIKEKTTNTRGTYSSGRYASGTFGIWSFTAQIGISADTKGNIGIQGSFSCSATSGSASASVGKYTMKTNAPSINKLNGLGYSVGGSAIVPLPAPIGLDAGADLNIIPDNIDKTMYLGYTKYAGVATPTPSGEAHIGWGNTTTFTSFNVYDAIDSLCVKIIEE